jgi:hypothetical protein
MDDKDLLLADFWDRYIKFDPDIEQLFDVASEKLHRFGYSVAKAAPPGFIYVRHEGWSAGRIRWVMGKPSPRKEVTSYLTGPRIGEAGADADEVAGKKLRNAINHFRSGTWVANGAIDPPTPNFDRININPEFWTQRDVVLDISENKLCLMDGTRPSSRFREVRIQMRPNIQVTEPDTPTGPGRKSKKQAIFQILDELRDQGKIVRGDPRKEIYKKIMEALGVEPASPDARGLDLTTVSNHIRAWENQLSSDT